MDPRELYHLNLTRRRFLSAGARTAGSALGVAALSSILRASSAPAARRGPHFAPKARRVIYLHMEGAPSHIDLWDYKPGLRQRYDQDLPDSIRQGQRLTGMTSGQARFPIAPSLFRFSRYPNNQDGAWISELMPFTAGLAHELCFV